MNLPPIGQQALRKGRVSEAGRLYFITKSARERVQKEWPVTEQLAQGRLIQLGVPNIIFDSLDWLQKHDIFTLLAYCIMPDHIHLLFQLGEKATLDTAIRQFASFTSVSAQQKIGYGALWAKGYYDHALRAEAEIEPIVLYIEHNPVKAGLVEDAREWQWSSAYILPEPTL